MNPQSKDTGFTVHSSTNSEKSFAPSEILITSTVTVHRPPLSPIPVVLAITPDLTPTRANILHPSIIDPLPFTLPPTPLARTAARKSKFSRHQRSFDATFCHKPTISALQNKIQERSSYENPPDLKFASDLSAETFSLLNPKLSSSLHSTCFVDGFLICESKDSSVSKFFSNSSS